MSSTAHVDVEVIREEEQSISYCARYDGKQVIATYWWESEHYNVMTHYANRDLKALALMLEAIHNFAAPIIERRKHET